MSVFFVQVVILIMSINIEALLSLYPTPKTQELSLLSRKIQQGDIRFIRKEIKNNPRLLVSSTDAPTILQEGFRYNALHVAGRYGSVEAAQFILATVNGVSFMKSLYPDDPQIIRDERTKFLTDMYLNTPDKGTLETPLHFACKFNYIEVVKILLGHPLCDTKLTNRDLETAENVIGRRASKVNEAHSMEIRKLFQANRIVPIWRDLKNNTFAIVGRPVNPKYLGDYTPAPFKAIYGDVILSHFGPVDTSSIPVSDFGTCREIRAYAGPTDEETAEILYNAIKGTSNVSHTYQTPPSSPSLQQKFSPTGHGDVFPSKLPSTPPRNFIRKSFCGTPTSLSNPCRCTPNRRTKSKDDFSTPPPLSIKTPLTSGLPSPSEFQYTPMTLSLMLVSPGVCTTPKRIVEDRKSRLKDAEKGFESVGRKYSAELEVPWNEYWTFLAEFVDLSSEVGLMMLEDHLNRINELEIEMKRQAETASEFSLLTNICDHLEQLHLGSGVTPLRVKEMFSEDWRNNLRTRPTRSYPVPAELESNSQNGASSHASFVPRRLVFDVRPLIQRSDDAMKNSSSIEQEDSDVEIIEDDGHSVYDTPYSSFPSSDMGSDDDFEDCDAVSLFVNGRKPSKEDFQALRAISSVFENISVEKFPNVWGWFYDLKAMAEIT